MSKLHDQIQADVKEAMKAKDMERVSTLRMCVSEIKKKLIDQKADRSDIQDEMVIKTIRTMIKQRQDSITAFREGGRAELAEKEEREAQMLEAYLPAQLPKEKIEAFVEEAIAETGASEMKDMGKVMNLVLQKAANQADGKVVSDIVKARLSKG